MKKRFLAVLAAGILAVSGQQISASQELFSDGGYEGSSFEPEVWLLPEEAENELSEPGTGGEFSGQAELSSGVPEEAGAENITGSGLLPEGGTAAEAGLLPEEDSFTEEGLLLEADAPEEAQLLTGDDPAAELPAPGRSPIVNVVTDSIIRGLEEPLRFFPNTFYQITVIGAGTSSKEPAGTYVGRDEITGDYVEGDTRYVQAYWMMEGGQNQNKSWRIGTTAGINQTREIPIVIYFQHQVFTNGKWAFGTPKYETISVNVKTKAYFNDVTDKTKFYFDPVYWASDKGITTGYNDAQGNPSGIFGVNDNCTREQIVTFLWRLMGSPEPSTAAAFSDLDSTKYYYKAVSWAAEKGITKGVSEDRFGVGELCSRAMCVTFLYRLAGQPEASGGTVFSDVVPGQYYEKAVAWASEKGITTGYNDAQGNPTGVFGVKDNCTRGQIVTFLSRYNSLS